MFHIHLFLSGRIKTYILLEGVKEKNFNIQLREDLILADTEYNP